MKACLEAARDFPVEFHRRVLDVTFEGSTIGVPVDQPGTGENPVPMTIEADETVLALVIEARKLGNGKIAHFGTSFGANYSAMTELTGAVDCSVVLGGPVKAAFEKGALARLPYGMPDIIANDMGFNRPPSPSEFAQTIGAFSRHALLERATNAPMLVINGADDYFVPHEDTRIFEGRAGTDIHLIEGTAIARSQNCQMFSRLWSLGWPSILLVDGGPRRP